VDGDGLDGVPGRVADRRRQAGAERAAGRKTPKKRGRAVSYSTGTWPVSSGGSSCTAVSPGQRSTRVPHSGQKRLSSAARAAVRAASLPAAPAPSRLRVERAQRLGGAAAHRPDLGR
jgi:hypothetical protein